MEWKIKYCTCMWCGISPLKEQGVTIPRIYPLYLGYHHTSLICHIISHYIVGGIFNPSVYRLLFLSFHSVLFSEKVFWSRPLHFGSFFFMLQLRLRLTPQRKIEKLIFNNKIKAKSICERKNSVCIKLP